VCERCRGECLSELSAESWAEVECPICDGYGKCSACDGGTFKLTQCARVYTRELVKAINMVSMVDKGFLPSAGGLLDQSAWFLDLMSAVNNEQNKIDSERLKGI